MRLLQIEFSFNFLSAYFELFIHLEKNIGSVFKSLANFLFFLSFPIPVRDFIRIGIALSYYVFIFLLWPLIVHLCASIDVFILQFLPKFRKEFSFLLFLSYFYILVEPFKVVNVPLNELREDKVGFASEKDMDFLNMLDQFMRPSLSCYIGARYMKIDKAR